MLKNAIKRIPGAERLAEALGIIKTGGRKFLLDMLPKHSVGAEIGVHMGGFSQQIIDVISPQELHLIDPWVHQTSAEYKEAWYGGGAKLGHQEMYERHSNVCDRFA